MKRTTVSAWMASGLIVVLLGATASSALAARSIDPASVDFGNTQVGTTSPSQTHSLRVYCDAPILVCALITLAGGADTFTPNVSTTGEFLQTNSCSLTLNGASPTGQSCIITSSFAPTSPGPKTGTLETGPGGPVATLTGTGVTAATPPTPPEPGGASPPPTPPTLKLSAKKQKLKKKFTFFATTNVTTTLVAGGSVKPTTKKLAGGERTKVRATPKKKVRKKLEQKLAKSGKAKTTINVAATDNAGSTAVRKLRIKLTD